MLDYCAIIFIRIIFIFEWGETMSVGLNILILIISISITSAFNYWLWFTFVSKQRDNAIVDKVYVLISESVELVYSDGPFEFACQVKWSLLRIYIIEDLELDLEKELDNISDLLIDKPTKAKAAKIITAYRTLFDAFLDKLAE